MIKHLTKSFLILVMISSVDANAHDIKKCDDNLGTFRDIYISNGNSKERQKAAFGDSSVKRATKAISFSQGACRNETCEATIEVVGSTGEIADIVYNDKTIKVCTSYFESDVNNDLPDEKKSKKNGTLITIRQNYEYPMEDEESQRISTYVEVKYISYNNRIKEDKEVPGRNPYDFISTVYGRSHIYSGIKGSKIEIGEVRYRGKYKNKNLGLNNWRGYGDP